MADVYYVVCVNRVVSDSSGTPRRFNSVKAANNFVRNHQLESRGHTAPVKDISKYSKRLRMNPTN
jgi:hypothetical protein